MPALASDGGWRHTEEEDTGQDQPADSPDEQKQIAA